MAISAASSVKSTIQAYDRSLKRKPSFQSSSGRKDIWGYMDFDKIDKVLYNILSNAAKYTPADKKVELNVSTLQRIIPDSSG